MRFSFPFGSSVYELTAISLEYLNLGGKKYLEVMLNHKAAQQHLSSHLENLLLSPKTKEPCIQILHKLGAGEGREGRNPSKTSCNYRTCLIKKADL